MKTDKEFYFIQKTHNPVPEDSTQYIWVLSARHTIKKEHNNCPVQAINFQVHTTHSTPADEMCDDEDDYQRHKLALEMAQKLVATRANTSIDALTEQDYEQHAPWILYNGTPQQNAALSDVLKLGLPSIGLPYYPADKFIVFDVDPKEMHTGGQLNALAARRLGGNTEAERVLAEKLAGLTKPNPQVTVVSSAYHINRLRRLFNSPTFKNPFEKDTTITFLGVDREYQRNCALRDCDGEGKRIETYTAKGDLGPPIKCRWFGSLVPTPTDTSSVDWLVDKPASKNWTPMRALFAHQQPMTNAQNIEALDLAKNNKIR